MMETALFNLIDLAVLLVIFESLVLLVLLLASRDNSHNKHDNSRTWLAWLLASFTIDALATLLYWTPPLKALIGDVATVTYLILRAGLTVQAPFLYLYTRSLLKTSPKTGVKNRVCVAIPLLISVLLICLTLMSLGAEGLSAATDNYAVLWHTTSYRLYLIWQALCLVTFTMLSLVTYATFTKKLKQQLSTVEDLDERWLQILMFGFLAMCIFYILAGIANYIGAIRLDHWFNVIGHYLDFLFINALIFYSLRYAPRQPLSPAKHPTSTDNAITPEQIKTHIENHAPFLDPNYQLQHLADALNASNRQVSEVINQQMQQNFFELINGYRVGKAQQLLVEHPDLPMLEVMSQSGFQTKSAFNRVFKTMAHCTPSHYRKQFTTSG